MFHKREQPLSDDDLRQIIAGLRYENQMLKKNADDEPWYYRFDHYFEAENLQYIIKYDPRIKQWFRYENGVFCPIDRALILQIIFEWGDFANEKMSPSKTILLMNRIQAMVTFTDQWDPNPNIDNCINGLVYKEERELHEHTWDYPSKIRISRKFNENLEPIIPDLFYQMVQIITNKEERDQFIQFLVNVVHCYYDEELFCIVYGPRNGGKSTLLRIFELILGPTAVSKTPLNKIGSRFGMANLYDKRVNVNPDLPIVPMSDATISEIKQLTGHDGLLPVEMKGRDVFHFLVRCFLIFGINQLMGFKSSSEKEIESIFRRVLLINVPTKLASDPAFKKSTEDPKFLDELYSWLVWMRPRQIINQIEVDCEEQQHIDKWIDVQKTKWLENANPILGILKEKYVWKGGAEIPCRDVYEYVREQLEEEGILSNQQLQTNVTQALQTMNIYRNNARGANAKYLNIAEVI